MSISGIVTDQRNTGVYLQSLSFQKKSILYRDNFYSITLMH